MKKFLLLFVLTLLFVSCEETKEVDGHNIVVIDSCEYIRCNTYFFHKVYVHKGNCKFCAERRKQEMKELIKIFNN